MGHAQYHLENEITILQPGQDRTQRYSSSYFKIALNQILKKIAIVQYTLLPFGCFET
jgi:hypothetical protein